MDANVPMEPAKKLGEQPWHLHIVAKTLDWIESPLTTEKALALGKNYSGFDSENSTETPFVIELIGAKPTQLKQSPRTLEDHDAKESNFWDNQ